MKSKAVPEEVYVPEEQVVYNDANISKELRIKKLIQENLVKSFVVAELDKDNSLDEFLKVDYAHAIGVMEGKGTYEGINSADETWMYEYKTDNDISHGGVAVIRNKKIIDFHEVWQRID